MGRVTMFRWARIDLTMTEIRPLFGAGMLPHPLGAVDMAKIAQHYGENPELLRLAGLGRADPHGTAV